MDPQRRPAWTPLFNAECAVAVNSLPTLNRRMDARLQKRWKVLNSLMGEAATQIAERSKLFRYEQYLSHNEFELALDELEAAGEEAKIDAHFWWLLKKSAQVMDLKAHRLRFQRKYQLLRQQVDSGSAV